MQIGTTGPRGIGRKRSTLAISRSKIKVTLAEDRFGSTFFDPLGRVAVLVHFLVKQLLVCSLVNGVFVEPNYAAATVPFVAYEEQFSVEKM